MKKNYWMKQSRQENLIYLAVWGMLFAAPLLSLYVRTVSDTNLVFDWTEVFIVWRKFIPFLLLFLIHNFLLAPLLVHGHKRIVKVSISDIRYVEGMSEYLKVWIEGETKPIITLLSMKKMEEHLPDYFMRIHRSYIINLTKIQEVNKNRVIMDSDTYLPVGDLYKEAFQTYLEGKFLGK